MRVKVQNGKLEKFACDLLVINLFQGLKKTGNGAGDINKALRGIVDDLIKDEKFKGSLGETIVIPTFSKRFLAKKVLLIGLGEQKEFNAESIRKVSAIAVKKAREIKAKTVGTILHGASEFDPEDAARSLTEGSMLAGYTYLKYKTGEEGKAGQFPQSVTIVYHGDAEKIRKISSGIKQAEIEVEGAIFARDLVNEPATGMKPKDLVDVAQAIAKSSSDIEVKIYNQKEIEKMGMGAFLAVASGSDDPPYFIHLTYKPKTKDKLRKIAFVGKGITFDSGGLSLKPSKFMEGMQCDMAGSATVLGIFSSISKLKPNAEVHGIAAVCENMPSGKAMKPGDIVITMSGKTIEILNTDAEGRLTLADALAYTVKNVKPDAIIDFATLTGACVVALGEEVAGYMGNNKDLLAEVKKAGETSGERMWELPMPEEYKNEIKSTVADYTNITPGKRGAGTITAGMLLQEFVGKIPWVHIDIAGPAWAEKEVIPYMPKGGTGFGVRTGLHLIKDI